MLIAICKPHSTTSTRRRPNWSLSVGSPVAAKQPCRPRSRLALVARRERCTWEAISNARLWQASASSNVCPIPPISTEAHRRVYAVLCDKAKMILAANHSVIVDAVYDSESDRDEIEAMAGTLGVPFRAFWLQADVHKLLARVAARHKDASDATPAIAQAQLGLHTGRLSPAWKVLNAGASGQETFRLAMAAAGVRLRGM